MKIPNLIPSCFEICSRDCFPEPNGPQMECKYKDKQGNKYFLWQNLKSKDIKRITYIDNTQNNGYTIYVSKKLTFGCPSKTAEDYIYLGIIKGGIVRKNIMIAKFG